MKRKPIDPARGFLPQQDPLETLPSPFESWEQAAARLPKSLASGRVRSELERLPPFPWGALKTQQEQERAMLLLSFMGHAYVWGGQEPAAILPEVLAVPWHRVAQSLGRPPVLSYDTYALNNWRRIDREAPVALGNIALLQNFLGGMDEEWFILVHVEIEARAARGLAALGPAQQAVQDRDARSLEEELEALFHSLTEVRKTLERMPERCDPYIYYQRVRPFIHGWKDSPALPEGLVYQGVDEWSGKPQRFRGETGAQSAIVPALDAALGILHREDPLSHYLREMRLYMPPAHRTFVETIEQGPSIRDYLTGEGAGAARARDLFNECVHQLAEFRALHLKYAASYIQQQSQESPANPTAVGTGGTPFMVYLAKHQRETEEQLL